MGLGGKCSEQSGRITCVDCEAVMPIHTDLKRAVSRKDYQGDQP